jgi:hypothetical protein
MDVRAILVVAPDRPEYAECFAEVPLAMLDVVGRNLVEHTAGRLRRFGIEEITVICEQREPNPALVIAPHPGQRLMVERENPWNVCQSVFNDFAQSGAEVVLVERLGAYVEVNFEDLMQFHLDRKAHVTSVSDGFRSLDLVAISASRRNDASFLFRQGLKQSRVLPAQYVFHGYTNLMCRPSDLRRLTCDVLLQRTELTPAGDEIRPGVWIGKGAHIERGARVVAPAYLGAGARIRAAALVTRASSVGHHAEIDCGTIVEASNVLPFSYVGAALELTNCVAGFRRLANLERKAEVDIADGKLLDVKSANFVQRVFERAALLTKFDPLEIIRGFFTPRRRLPALGTAQEVPSAALSGAAEMEEKHQEQGPAPPSPAPIRKPTYRSEEIPWRSIKTRAGRSW